MIMIRCYYLVSYLPGMSFPVLVPEILAEVELVFSAVALWLEPLSLSVVWILTHQGQLWRPQQLLPCSKNKNKNFNSKNNLCKIP